MSDLSRQLRYICSKRDFDGKACGKCYYCQAADEIEELKTRLKLANDYVESLVAMINK